MKAHRILNIDRSDYPRLWILAPTFAVVAACTVILASLSKALFLSSSPISLLPWMFLGAAVITATTSLGYVALMRAMRIAARFRLLLSVAVGSLLLLWFGFDAAPATSGVVILLWCPAIGHLLVVQVWNVASSLLPTRQGKRMMPVLAAVTTLGAALGGISVQVLLRWLEAEDLLLVAAGALVLPLLRVGAVIEGLGGDGEGAAPSAAGKGAHKSGAEQDDGGSEVAKGFRSIARRPLLTDLALLMFLLQAASLIIDYQFSAEIKPQFDKEGIAAFLGTFYWTSNLVVLALTLLATSRFVRLVGIGVALAASGIVLGVGSGLYFVSALTPALPAFWVIAATAFMERVASYAFTKPAIQMVYMPLQTAGGERAKTIIDGVIYRLATALVSVLLLVAAPELATQFRLSLPATVACAVVLYLGYRIGPHYRRALFEALQASRLDAGLAAYLRDGLGGRATAELEAQLGSGSPKEVVRALDVARGLEIDLGRDRLETLAEHDDERVAKAALSAMEALGHHPDRELLDRLLAAHRPPRILRALLVLFSEGATKEMAESVRPLIQHDDQSVASAACVFRIRALGAEASFDAEMKGQTAKVRVTGMTRAGDFARELPAMVRAASPTVRHDAIEQMGELGLDAFVAPLIACLDVYDQRQNAVDALVRFGDRAMARLSEHLQSSDLRLVSRIALISVAENVHSAEATELLVAVWRSQNATLRNYAVEALWRRSGMADVPQPDPGVLRELAARDIERLEVLSAIELALSAETANARAAGSMQRLAAFASEVSALQLAAERRVFRTMAMIYDRAALMRAYLHYKSRETRVRSNAIELLEQHIDDAALHPFVALIERQEDAKGNMRPRSMVVRNLGTTNIEELVTEDAWLGRLWAWRKERGAAELTWDEPLDRLVELKQIPMFEEATGEPLLEVARSLTRLSFDEGELVFERGDESRDVYWILRGRVALLLRRGDNLELDQATCFGEMAALDGRPRACGARALSSTVTAKLERGAFEDALEMFPTLLHRMVEVISARLRERIT